MKPFAWIILLMALLSTGWSAAVDTGDVLELDQPDYKNNVIRAMVKR